MTKIAACVNSNLTLLHPGQYDTADVNNNTNNTDGNLQTKGTNINRLTDKYVTAWSNFGIDVSHC